MIDSRYLKYIPIEDHEYYRNILLKGNELDLSKENLILIK